MNKITPHLWFEKNVKDAVNFYLSVFPNAKITSEVTIHDVPTPTGDTTIVSFEIGDQPFMAIDAGPDFKFNPSISFFVNFDPSKDPHARENLDKTWEKLSEGGEALMELDKYPFSEHYGWIKDKYGVTWQLMLTNPDGEDRPYIIPSMMFVNDNAGKAEEAIDFYTSVFKGSKKGTLARYPKGMEPDKEGTIMFGDFSINDTWIAAMDSAHEHKFDFGEAISLLIPCDTQEEIDYFWEKLSVDPDAEQCGWLKDKFGVSWQVHPTPFNDMMEKGSREQIDRVTHAFLQMKKFDIQKLKEAFEGKYMKTIPSGNHE